MERLVDEVAAKYQARFLDSSRQIVSQAAEVAREWGHRYAHVTHLAIPLLESPAIEQFFRRVGLSTQIARRNIEQGFIQRSVADTGKIKATPSFNRAVEIADQSAGPTNLIRPEDLFLGVVLEGGLSGIGVHASPARSWRAFLLELSTFGTTETGQIRTRTSPIDRLKERQEFNLQVKELRDQRLSNAEIADQLGVPFWRVAQASQRLISHGETKRIVRTGRDYAEVDSKIKGLRSKGVPDEDIRQSLGLTYARYRERVRKLLATGEIILNPKGVKSRADRNYDEEIKKLRAEGLKSRDIRQRLGLTDGQYRWKIHKLLREGEVVEIPRGRRGTATHDTVKKLRGKGYGNKRISEESGISLSTVTVVLRKLDKAGENVRLRKRYRTREEAKQFKEYVAQLRLDPRNLTIKQIAEITGESETLIVDYTNKLIREGRIPKRGLERGLKPKAP